jgi:branched-chain amino acid transport system ATP-binding protein
MENLTVYENVMVSRLPRRSSKSSAKESVDEQVCLRCINFVGLNGSEGFLAKNLPYGDKRRLELARALAVEPKLILVDEPTAGMNQVEVEYFISLLKKIKESGIGVFCIEHNMTVAMGISDRIMVLDYGVKIAEGTPKEISENQKVIEAYLGRQKC